MTRKTAQGRAAPITFYAAQSGKFTLDQGEGGGNPFASALIELLERPSLTLAQLRSDLIPLTLRKSSGIQQPEIVKGAASPRWRVKPIHTSGTRTALVFVYSDYQGIGANPLPGAKRDCRRVATALQQAGFVVQTAVDPTMDELRIALEALSSQSENAEAALIYTTGHGIDYNEQAYLLPNKYPIQEGTARLEELAIQVPNLVDHLKSKKANLLFFGGCRTRI